MGLYIEVPKNLGKAEQIRELYGGQIVPRLSEFSQVPEGKALIVVVDNGVFEAAAFCDREREFRAFTDPTDPRPSVHVLMDHKKACELTIHRSESCKCK